MRYEGSPKHKQPWHPGARGSLCPPEVDPRLALSLLAESVALGTARFGVWQGQAFCAREHGPGVWHGYPVGWHEVPPAVRHQWLRTGRMARSDVRRKW